MQAEPELDGLHPGLRQILVHPGEPELRVAGGSEDPFTGGAGVVATFPDREDRKHRVAHETLHLAAPVDEDAVDAGG